VVGLDRTRPVDNLLSTFHAAPSNPYLTSSRMATTASASPRTGAGEIVPRRTTGLGTSSQTERRAPADAGDLGARVDLIPLNVVEDQLSRYLRTAQPACSTLNYLGTTKLFPAAKPASIMLEEFADSTEQAALTPGLGLTIRNARLHASHTLRTSTRLQTRHGTACVRLHKPPRPVPAAHFHRTFSP
jgi:hypothetical protein